MKDRYFLVKEDPDTTYYNDDSISCADAPNIGFIIYEDKDTKKAHYIYSNIPNAANSHYAVRRQYDKLGIDDMEIREVVQGRIWPKHKIAATYQVEHSVMKYKDLIEKMFEELGLDIGDYKWDFLKNSYDDPIPWPGVKSVVTTKELDPEAQKKLDDLIQMMHIATPDEKEKIKAKIRAIQNVYGIEMGEIERRVTASLMKKAQAAGEYDSIARANYYKGAIAESKFRVYNKSLDTKLWNDGMSLEPTVRASLLKIAQDFYKSTELSAPIYDILFIGSSANFNWTPNSDLDLHIVIDITQVGIEPSLARSFMDGLAAKWNTNHEIEIKGHPVEVYLQDIREKNSTAALAREGAAIYSVLNNAWVKQPNTQKLDIDKDKIKQKYHSIKKKIAEFVLEKDVDKLKQLMKNIRNYRDAGLTKAGEFGTENLVFKALRYTGELTKLKDAINSIYDKSVTVTESCQKTNSNPNDSNSSPLVV